MSESAVIKDELDENQVSSEPKWLVNLTATIKEACRERFSTYCGLSSIEELSEVSCEESHVSVYGHWMALILLAGENFRFTFKTYYNTQDVIHMASTMLQKKSEKEDVRTAGDFMKEFNNLLAGTVKSAFEDIQLSMGISLPILIRGFDDLYSDEMQQVDSDHYFKRNWALKKGEQKVCFSFQLNTIGEIPKVMEEIKFVDHSDDDLEFL